MRPHRFLIGSLLLLLLASCGHSRYIVGGAGQSGNAISAVPPARSIDISFQTAISDDGIPTIAPLPGSGIVACQIITPNELGVSRLDDSLRALWSARIPLAGTAPPNLSPFEHYQLAPAAEHPIRLVATPQEAGLFTYQRLAGDSIELKLRRFDMQAGQMLEEAVIHRGSFAETIPEAEKVYHSIVSPDGRLIVIYMISGEQSGFQRQFDMQLFQSDLTLLASKRIYVTGRTSRDTLQAISVDNAGTLYLLHQDERSSLDVVRLNLLRGGTPERIVAKLADTANSMMRLEPFTMRIEPDSTLTAVAVGRVRGNLDGLAVVRIDLRNWTFLTAGFRNVGSDMLAKLIGKQTMEQPALHSLLRLNGDPHWIAVIEEREPYLGDRDTAERTPTGSLVSIAFDSVAQMMWLRGTSRGMPRTSPEINSVITQGAPASGAFRVFYNANNATGDFFSREYYLGNGAELTPVPRKLLSAGENGSVLLPYTLWLSDRTVLLTVLTNNREEVRLCRVDLK